MIERSRRVVLLIDYDNLQICASRDTPGRDLQLVPVVQLAQRYGTVILARAYAEWNLSTERLAVYKAGIEPAFAPVLRTESDRSGKSLADTVMVAEGMDMLWTLSPDVVVLATSDKDLIPLVRVAKQRGAHVVVLGSDFTAVPLREMADEHITYRQLITDAAGRYVTEAGPGRQPAAPPETGRRRTRDRNGREGRAAPQPAPATHTPPTPAAAPEAAAAQPPRGANGATAVPPITAGEADGQISGGRRRRRRGSRRRGERLGVTGEPLPGEPGEPTAAEEPPAETAEPAAAEAPPAEPPVPASLAEASMGTLEAPPEAPAARPRRTRRGRGAAAATSPAEAAAGEALPPVEEVPQPSTNAHEPPQEALAAEEPGAPVEGSEAAEAAAPPARRTRARRVASAARGRSRPTSR